MAEQRYVLALGSNQPHHRFGAPEMVLGAALERLAAEDLRVLASSPIFRTDPLGPSRRRYANSAALVASALMPEALLALLQNVERTFGRKRRGRRWQARVLDLDIVLWSGGACTSPGLVLPHPAYRNRAFVLRPAVTVAPRWRDPITGLTTRHLLARLGRARPRTAR